MRRCLNLGVPIWVALLGLLTACTVPRPESPRLSPEQEALRIERLEGLYADLLAVGAPVSGWSEEGDDPFDHAAAGPDRAWLLLEDRRGRRQLLIPADRGDGPALPRDWRRIESWSDKGGAGEGGLLQIQPIDDRFVLVARGGYRRVGTAFCAEGGAHLALYERPRGSSERDARETALFAGYLFGRTRAVTLCQRFDAIAGGRFALTNFTEDGRPLITLNEQREIGVVVAVGPIERLLGLD